MIELLRALATPDASVVAAAPSSGEGYWAGGPSAVVADGVVWLAYRLRRPVGLGRGYANVIARSSDGLRFEPVARITSAELGCASLQRPALLRRPHGGWRLYVSCATPTSKHWWVQAFDAETPEGLPTGRRTVVLPGSDVEAWKDVVVRVDARGWRMWACRHPLDCGDDEADRMSSWYAESPDGLSWTMLGEALAPTPDSWHARGARMTDAHYVDGRWWAIFDGRATAEENFRERSGLAVGDRPGQLTAIAGPVPPQPGIALRYASFIRQGGGWRAYFETTAADGSHELRTVYVPPTSDVRVDFAERPPK